MRWWWWRWLMLCLCALHLIAVHIFFFVHNQMEACLLHGPFFTSKSSSHVRFTIKNVNLFQVVSECIENTETKKEIYKIKLHALYLDKIIQYSSCMKRFAYDWSRWQILNMAFKFLFILFMVASFGMALWMSVSLLCFCFQCVQISALYCFSFLFYFGVGWVILLRIFMAFSQQNCFGFTWSYGGNTCVLTAQHTVLLHRMKWVYFSHWDEKWLRHIEGKHCICVWISSFTEFDSSFCNLFFAINLSKVLYRR